MTHFANVPSTTASGCGGSREELSTRAVDDLLRMLKVRGRQPPASSLSAALRELGRRPPSPEIDRAVGVLLADKAAHTRDRARAALQLQRSSAATAEPLLLAQLGADEEVLHSAVLRSLAHVGQQRALEALQKLPTARAAFLDTQRGFAMQVIAHRLGVPAPAVTHAAKRWTPDARTRRVPLGHKALDRSSGAKLLTVLGSHAYGVELDPAFAVAFEDRQVRTPTHLVFSKTFVERDGWAALARAPFVLGVLTHTHERTGAMMVWQVLLATPNGRSIDLRGYRGDGELGLDGHAVSKGDAIHFELSSIEAPGRCRHVLAGTRTRTAMTWERHESTADRLPKRTPVASKWVKR